MKLNIAIILAIITAAVLYALDSYIGCMGMCAIATVLLLIQEQLDKTEYRNQRKQAIELRKLSREMNISGASYKNI